jgi:hypothetical protein
MRHSHFRPRRSVLRLFALARVVEGVENPVDSRPEQPSAQSKHASALLVVRWLPSCCPARMDHDELRARIRQLMASGDLPPVHPLTDTPPGNAVRITMLAVGRPMPEPCLTCGESNPTVSYTYANQQVVCIHTACDALWEQECKCNPDGAGPCGCLAPRLLGG